MSSPTRVVTPELELELTETLGLLDAIAAGYDARVPATLVALAVERRAKLLEAFEEARA